jgi:hypothetical protein
MAATFWPYNYEPAGPRGGPSHIRDRIQQNVNLTGQDMPVTSRGMRPVIQCQDVNKLILRRKLHMLNQHSLLEQGIILPIRVQYSQATTTKEEVEIKKGING